MNKDIRQCKQCDKEFIPKVVGGAYKALFCSRECSNKDPRRKEPHTESHKKKISQTLRGKRNTSEHNENIRRSRLGKHHSEKTRQKMSEKKRGDKHPRWLGGKSFEPYSIDWTETLKRSICERDRYICRLCGEVQTNTTHSVHHVDYDKKNNNPDNLITLCSSCHGRTNMNRKYWENFLDWKVA